MSTLRERKAVAAFAAADAAANAAEAEGATLSSEQRADAALAAAARAAASAAPLSASGTPPAVSAVRRARPSLLVSLLRLLPYVLLFLAIFVSISYVSTGTPHYGLAHPALQARLAASWPVKQFRRTLNRAKINVQEWAGLRAPRVAKKPAPASNAEANKGYGGITPSKKQASSGGGMPNVGGETERVRITPRPKEHDPRALYLTPDELSKFTGADEPSGTILLAVYGRIFDVTSGRIHYGPEGNYHNLAAKDVSRAFATNCFDNEQLHDLRGLSDEQRRHIDSWYKSVTCFVCVPSLLRRPRR
jgi:predicted heme/steroid binding protein